ncbi:hypothetical protein C8R41DRAFT_830248 [Lentinula lateritia]|uniref:Uncharacterized protein n=1 Tax=Lentinula lateritia TaxID=40482 RepID=A0ABQ8VGZ1_9AGAR|nr:hypothetical protein C8R41DRAFT_830248 [Lentinula lateritia]
MQSWSPYTSTSILGRSPFQLKTFNNSYLNINAQDMVFFRILLTALLTAAAISSVLAAPVLQRDEPTITVIPGQAPTSLSTEVLDRETTTISGTPTHAPTPVLNVVLARGMDIW